MDISPTATSRAKLWATGRNLNTPTSVENATLSMRASLRTPTDWRHTFNTCAVAICDRFRPPPTKVSRSDPDDLGVFQQAAGDYTQNRVDECNWRVEWRRRSDGSLPVAVGLVFACPPQSDWAYRCFLLPRRPGIFPPSLSQIPA